MDSTTGTMLSDGVSVCPAPDLTPIPTRGGLVEETVDAPATPPPPAKSSAALPGSPAGVSRTAAWSGSNRSGDDAPVVGRMERKRSAGNGRAASEAGNLDLIQRQVRHRMRKAVGAVAGLVIDEVGVDAPTVEDTFAQPQLSALSPGGSNRRSSTTSRGPGPRGRASSVSAHGGARCRSVSIAARNGTGGSLFREGGSDRGFGPTAAAGAASAALGALAEDDDEAEPADEEAGEGPRILKPEGYHRFNRVRAAGGSGRAARRLPVARTVDAGEDDMPPQPPQEAAEDVDCRHAPSTIMAGVEED